MILGAVRTTSSSVIAKLDPIWLSV